MRVNDADNVEAEGMLCDPLSAAMVGGLLMAKRLRERGWRPQDVIESYLGLRHDCLGLFGVVHHSGLGPEAGDASPLIPELEA